jgi:hypothetical protein
MKSSPDYDPMAVSEQDFICSFTDTFTDPGLVNIDPIDNRPHLPLGLEVNQRTFAWSYSYSEDFIIFDYTIRNINRFPLKQIYFGIYIDADVYHEANSGGTSWQDDICGYLHSVPSIDPPGFEDTIRIAWTADNDGDPTDSEGHLAFNYQSPLGLTGTAVLRSPNPDLKYSFNWWVTHSDPNLDWGPRQAGSEEKPFRDFGTGMGSPTGDRNKYYILSSNEFDYDQLESAISHTGEGFLQPPRNAENFADGYDARYLFSFGPFDLQPDDTLPITLAYVAGDNFHQNPGDFAGLWDALNPGLYINQLDFTDLGINSRWAHWIFDNPGVDTDGDNDSGKVRWVIDSLTMDSTKYFYAGDGVPDFMGASPPPAPEVRVIPEFGRLKICWNGQVSEQSIDVFSQINDFEGYRVYYGEDNRDSDYILMATYDRDDYNLYQWDPQRRSWQISETPILLDSVRTLFGETFEPGLYSDPNRPYEYEGQFYYFSPQGWNNSDLSNITGIHKVYPHADTSDPADTTQSGWHRAYEYEYIIDNLQPSKPYYVTVTAFDFGSRKVSISALESALNINSVLAYPLPSTEQVEAAGLSVQVYPNPYRIDGGYAADGYENRDRTVSAERSRSIHFYNLPAVCKIRIYTLSGDLVQEIDHYRPEGGPEAMHERWNLISKNTQAVVTGIYIYHVSSSIGEQIGKLVIIK